MIVEGQLGEVSPARARELAIAVTGVLGVGLLPRSGGDQLPPVPARPPGAHPPSPLPAAAVAPAVPPARAGRKAPRKGMRSVKSRALPARRLCFGTSTVTEPPTPSVPARRHSASTPWRRYATVSTSVSCGSRAAKPELALGLRRVDPPEVLGHLDRDPIDRRLLAAVAVQLLDERRAPAVQLRRQLEPRRRHVRDAAEPREELLHRPVRAAEQVALAGAGRGRAPPRWPPPRRARRRS